MRSLLSAIFALAASSAAQAQPPQASDSVAWDTSLGRMTYTLESGPYGVLAYELAYGDNVGRLYIEGLAGEFGGNGPLVGYWSEPDVSHDDEIGDTLICPFAIIDSNGRTTNNWGRIRIMFTDVDFPSDFVLQRARCFEEPTEVIAGKLAHYPVCSIRARIRAQSTTCHGDRR
jgi:hypothetical protein